MYCDNLKVIRVSYDSLRKATAYTIEGLASITKVKELIKKTPIAIQILDIRKNRMKNQLAFRDDLLVNLLVKCDRKASLYQEKVKYREINDRITINGLYILVINNKILENAVTSVIC